jgi:exonuclease VII small subunit|tara:strand:- start:172 stop:393 length:222 start_codon:yes stop_codon:yes gene_type:complete
MERINSLISKINSLDLSLEQNIEIYKIIKKDNVKIMKNNNGAFVNLSNVSENILKELENLVSYIDKNELVQNK